MARNPLGFEITPMAGRGIPAPARPVVRERLPGPVGRSGFGQSHRDHHPRPSPRADCYRWRIILVSGRIRAVPEEDFQPLVDRFGAPERPPGGLFIEELDNNGTPFPGFRNPLLEGLRILTSRPRGRELVTGLINLTEHRVVIRASTQPIVREGVVEDHNGWGYPGDAQAASTAGRGSGTCIYFRPNPDASPHPVFGAGGATIPNPFYILLGHELIHARRFAAGRSRVSRTLPHQAHVWEEYHNEEERETIATGDLTENDLRREHGLPLRYGHSAPEPSLSNEVLRGQRGLRR